MEKVRYMTEYTEEEFNKLPATASRIGGEGGGRGQTIFDAMEADKGYDQTAIEAMCDLADARTNETKTPKQIKSAVWTSLNKYVKKKQLIRKGANYFKNAE